MTDEHGPVSAAVEAARSLDEWNLTYQRLRETVIAAALAWYTAHRLQLLPDASKGEAQLRERLCAEADRLLDDAVVRLMAGSGTPDSGPDAGVAAGTS